jgi:hypothetical protein
MDFLITYFDGTKKVVEVKPTTRLSEKRQRRQIKDSLRNAFAQGYKFELWTEENLGISSSEEATKLADEYRKKHYFIDYAEYRKKKNRLKAKKHYDAKISQDKVIFYCSFCKTDHSRLRKTYDENVKANGRFICIKENGHLAGKKAKTHLRKPNIFSNLGMKECVKCKMIKEFSHFNLDKSRNDGYANRCKECRKQGTKPCRKN